MGVEELAGVRWRTDLLTKLLSVVKMYSRPWKDAG